MIHTRAFYATLDRVIGYLLVFTLDTLGALDTLATLDRLDGRILKAF